MLQVKTFSAVLSPEKQANMPLVLKGIECETLQEIGENIKAEIQRNRHDATVDVFIKRRE